MSDMRRGCVGLAVIAALIALVLGAVFSLSSLSCNAKWQDFEHRFEAFSGCQVKIDGRWIPHDRVREIDL